MKYDESLGYLKSLSYQGIRLGLENTHKILQHFGNPQFKTPTIHIAGTNGKGSTAAILESILRTSGCRVGLYTSPHLLDIRERFQINRQCIEKEIFAELASHVRRASEILKSPVTYFEFGTVIAFLYFAEYKLDWCVVEVGMGGRLDATNLCNAELSILTSISQDHEDFLGTNTSQIAYEKASIIKENGIVIADLQEESVAVVIRQMAQDRNARLFEFKQDYFAEQISLDQRSQVIDFQGLDIRLDSLVFHLIGRHQTHNAALAIAASLVLRTQGTSISDQAIRTGLKETRWQGRLEQVGSNPVILLDGAHNPNSAKLMAEAVKDHFEAEKNWFIIALMKDKDIEKIANILSEPADRIILTGLPEERAENPKKLYEFFKKSQKPIEIIGEISYAIALAKKMASPRDLICITGSLCTVAEAKRYLGYERYS